MQVVTRLLPLASRRVLPACTSTRQAASSPFLQHQRRTMTSSSSSSTFLDAITKRRTFYQISSALPEGLTEDKIESIAKQIILHVPSAFNSQVINHITNNSYKHSHPPISLSAHATKFTKNREKKGLILGLFIYINMQSTRIVVLFQKEHEKLWSFISDILKAIVAPTVCPLYSTPSLIPLPPYLL